MPPLPEKRLSHSSAAVFRPSDGLLSAGLSDGLPFAGLLVESPVAQVTYVQDLVQDLVYRGPSDVAPLIQDSSGGIFIPPTESVGIAEASYLVSAEPLSALAHVEYPRDGELASLVPVEPPSSDLTYMDLLSNQARGAVSDFQQFYSPEGMAWLAGGLGAGAVMANTGFDEHFMRDIYVDNIVLAPSTELYEILHQPKFLGDGYYTIPAFAIAALAEPLIGDSPLGSRTAEWGQRSLRTILVGGPPMLGLQRLTGGGRPDETNESSEWQPFRDNNGVSGHSFMGAIAFISAAKMTDDIGLKAALYAASTLPGISRINDDAHYFSQVFLGWWLAYIAESAVDRSFSSSPRQRWHIYPSPNGVGLLFLTQW